MSLWRMILMISFKKYMIIRRKIFTTVGNYILSTIILHDRFWSNVVEKKRDINTKYSDGIETWFYLDTANHIPIFVHKYNINVVVYDFDHKRCDRWIKRSDNVNDNVVSSVILFHKNEKFSQFGEVYCYGLLEVSLHITCS